MGAGVLGDSGGGARLEGAVFEQLLGVLCGVLAVHPRVRLRHVAGALHVLLRCPLVHDRVGAELQGVRCQRLAHALALMLHTDESDLSTRQHTPDWAQD